MSHKKQLPMQYDATTLQYSELNIFQAPTCISRFGSSRFRLAGRTGRLHRSRGREKLTTSIQYPSGSIQNHAVSAISQTPAGEEEEEEEEEEGTTAART
jgi:hypothetical protein